MAEVNLDIIAYDAITVTGTVTSPGPNWDDEIVRVAVRGESPPFQPFHARGVRKGHPAELFFLLYEESAWRSLMLTAEQTAGDLNLGDIQFPEIGSGADVSISVTDHENLWEPGGLFPMWTHITMISDNGQTILSYPIDPKTNKAVQTLQTVQEYQKPSVPAARYFVSPGLFDNRTQQALLDLIRAGRQKDLLAAGVLTIVAVDGEERSLTFSAKDARDTIRTLADLYLP